MSEGALLPCPFCGGEAAPTAHLTYSWFAPRCKSCGVTGPAVRIEQDSDPQKVRELMNKADALWNTRAGAHQDTQTNAWSRPLIIAAARGERDVVEALIKAGASLDLGDTLERTALMEAVDTGEFDVAVLLLKSGADPNLVDADGQTIWQLLRPHWNSGERRSECERMAVVLLESGATPPNVPATTGSMEAFIERVLERLVMRAETRNAN